MPPRTPAKPRQPVRAKSDPTVSVAAAAGAKAAIAANTAEQGQKDLNQPKESNDDLKKLIETLKNKLGNTGNTPAQKQAPPVPKAKTIWNRSITKDEKSWAPKPAYTILTRVSNHEKVPTKSTKTTDITINALPHSFLYRPGADRIKVDKITVKAGKQVGWG